MELIAREARIEITINAPFLHPCPVIPADFLHQRYRRASLQQPLLNPQPGPSNPGLIKQLCRRGWSGGPPLCREGKSHPRLVAADVEHAQLQGVRGRQHSPGFVGLFPGLRLQRHHQLWLILRRICVGKQHLEGVLPSFR